MTNEVQENVNELRTRWFELDLNARKEIFWNLPRPDAEELFLTFTPQEQIEILEDRTLIEKRSWIRLLAPDDAADLIQEIPQEDRQDFLSLLDDYTRLQVNGLLAYEEDNAGGLMNPQYVRLRPDITVEEAIRYLRSQALTNVETFYYAYVLDTEQRLVGIISFRDLFIAGPKKRVDEIMKTELITIPDEMDQEEVSRLFSQHDIMAIPVVDAAGKMKGVVTFDDIVTVVEEEATEDIQKLGGMEALESPYLKTDFLQMIKSRAGWLVALFVGEMLTATAMARYELEIEKAVVLALFIPLIISSGGNSGSQASTLIIRSLALQEVRLRDWPRVFVRELGSGLVLGLILGIIGLLRIVLWQQWTPVYGEHYMLLGLVVSISLIGVVLWGTLSGSMLPFILSKLGFDPASASAPFVATVVDVTGVIIYFTMATILLKGTLL